MNKEQYLIPNCRSLQVLTETVFLASASHADGNRPGEDPYEDPNEIFTF